MTAGDLLLWVGLMLIGFAGSALYSGLETGSYQLNRIRLHVRAEKGQRTAQSLAKLLGKPAVLLTTLLLANNVANYLGTLSLSVLLDGAGLSPIQTIVLNTLIVTPVLFVFGEVLPKDLFGAAADRVMYRLAPVLTFTRTVAYATGLGFVVQAFSAVVLRLVGQRDGLTVLHPRRRFGQLVREGVGYGVLSDEQSGLAERVLASAGRKIGDEMVPWDRAVILRHDEPAERLRELADRSGRSRFPVVQGDQVVGVVNAVAYLARPADAPHTTLADLAEPAVTLRSAAPLRSGLARMQQEHVGLAVVVDDDQKPVGVATVKDLIEPITGELAAW
ncbi:MAG: CNNM domain-containing protein [Planctomycetota bacterium]